MVYKSEFLGWYSLKYLNRLLLACIFHSGKVDAKPDLHPSL